MLVLWLWLINAVFAFPAQQHPTFAFPAPSSTSFTFAFPAPSISPHFRLSYTIINILHFRLSCTIINTPLTFAFPAPSSTPSLSPFLHHDLHLRPPDLSPITFRMPNIKRLPLMPNEDELYAALEKIEATDAAFITILRKRSQHNPLHNIISGLWFVILYRVVEQHTSSDKGMRKDSRYCAIYNLVACLYAGKEISSYNNNVSKIISKRIRLGRASWSMISEEPGLLAVFNFLSPPSEEELHEL
jgi:hypothetical protein